MNHPSELNVVLMLTSILRNMDYLLYTLSVLFIATSFIPLIKNDYWTFRVFEYPRIQKLVLLILLLLSVIFFTSVSTLHWLIIVGLLITIAYLLYQIVPFTPLWKTQILKVKKCNPQQCITLVSSNVLEDNRNYEGCIEMVNAANPDVVLFLETDEGWVEALSVLDKDYPYSVKQPIHNTYGMLLFSKFPLKDTEVRFLVEKDIPSIHAKVKLPSGVWIQLHALHPTPPVPTENPRSTERDKELLLVADMVRKDSMPNIVFGDMNDVAWSYTTILFQKMSQMLDPRRGRGFFNTFHAHHWFLRFPLDHFFLTTDFKLKRIKRLTNFDSDHFPMLIEVQYEPNASKQQAENIIVATEQDKQEAKEKKEAI